MFNESPCMMNEGRKKKRKTARTGGITNGDGVGGGVSVLSCVHGCALYIPNTYRVRPATTLSSKRFSGT